MTVNSAGVIGVLVGNTGLGAALGPFPGRGSERQLPADGRCDGQRHGACLAGRRHPRRQEHQRHDHGVTSLVGVQIGNTPANTGNSLAGGLTNPTGNITVVDAGPNALGIVAFGGKDVNITTAGGSVTVGDATGVLASNQPTGKVTINDNVLVG